MNNNQLNAFFLRLAEELDISDTLFERAEKSYMALGEYINNNSECDVGVYTQGSFRLGTVIRPLSDDDEYDLDLACEVSCDNPISAKELKHMIGDILSKSKRYSSMLEEKRRCWRIEYSDEAQFHMDITPAVLSEVTQNTIKVTDKNDSGIYVYTQSNPKGYSDWFDERKLTTEIRTDALFEAKGVERVIEENHKNKLPLQRAIQILKRHRDLMFEEDSDNAPISIIITTLSAHAYKGVPGVYDALAQIIRNMDKCIEHRRNGYYIENPSNPRENFADKWNIEPEKVVAFNRWLNKVREDILTVSPTIVYDYSALNESFGEAIISRAKSPVKQGRTGRAVDFKNTEELIESQVRVDIRYNLKIDCRVTQKGFRDFMLSRCRAT
jgi:hypothetical protein